MHGHTGPFTIVNCWWRIKWSHDWRC